MIIGNTRFTRRKESRKVVSVVLQLIVLAGLLALIITALFTWAKYEPYTSDTATFAGDKGFIALSYFGVDRVGDNTLISVDKLRKHLQAIKDQGYVTITQQDIKEYYTNGKELPEKSLFLMFEDGRRDTTIFTEQILEDLNFKATALTYTEKFELEDPKFLSPEDLIDLQGMTFWEMGSNGHRLAFINVFDRYDNFLGELTPLKYSRLASYLGRNYNHYLMDYIRDKNHIPNESNNQMKDRIAYDYRRLDELYKNIFGATPELHVLMHSNTGAFGNDPQVSAANAYWIKKLFKMNFNREGYSLNNRDSSIYDLTRMQPQSYWPTNHLLMRVKYDINSDIKFVKGDESRYNEWTISEGAAEFKDETILLTSLPEGRGFMRLNGSDEFKDMKVSVKLLGNRLGRQTIYLRAAPDMTYYLAVTIADNVLLVSQKSIGAEKELFKLDLKTIDGISPVSVAEDKKATEEKELETFALYADNVEQGKVYLNRLKEKQEEQATTVADGSEEYIATIGSNSRGSRKVDIDLSGDKLNVIIDGKSAAESVIVADDVGGVCLAAGWGGYGWSQRNLADDVYDGVFEGLLITKYQAGADPVVLFESAQKGWDGILFAIKKRWNAVINWFITYL